MYSLFKKEVRTFLSSVIGYVFIIIYLITSGLFHWVISWDGNLMEGVEADLIPFFNMSPIIFLILIPAITMKSIAEETGTGTMELLVTKPISSFQILLSKYLAAITLLVISILPTTIYYISIYYLGDPVGIIDAGATLASYLGLVLLGACFTAIGLFASSISSSQIIAFVSAMFMCWFLFDGLYLIGSFKLMGGLDSIIQYTSMTHHYDSIKKGVLDSRDLIYFLSIIIFFLLAALNMIRIKKNWSLASIIGVSLILINTISTFKNIRIDLTEDQRYSISEGTEKFLNDTSYFKNRLSIKIYLDGNLPAELKTYKSSLEDKLKEFKNIVGDRVEYIFIDPNKGSDQDQKALYESLYSNGIRPMDISYSKDGGQSQLMVWPGAILDYSGQSVNTIQFLPGSSLGKPYEIGELHKIVEDGINNLEYQLISSMKRTMQKEKKKIAFLQGHGELSYAQTMRSRALLKPYYNISDVELKDSLSSLNDIDGLIIAEPTRKFTNKDLYIIDQFVMNGGKLMCFIDALTINSDSLDANGATHSTRSNLRIDKMLYDYGIKINENFVVDASCSPKIFPYAKNTFMPWFFHVLCTNTDHPISRNLEPVSLKYVNELEFIPQENITSSSILSSSTNSTSTGLSPIISLEMPVLYGPNPKLNESPKDEANKMCLAGITEGKYQSHFKSRIVDEFAKNPDANYLKESVKNSKVAVIGNGSWLANTYDSMPDKSRNRYLYRPININELEWDKDLIPYMEKGLIAPKMHGNQVFLQNLVDYMMGDQSIIDLRSRQIEVRPIDKEKVMTKGSLLRIVNVIIPIAIILLMGLIMYFIRKMKYSK
ncbi:MAG: hypothetical protein CL824_05535 [Crocinitomicaceae bacterium]|nr:hypothetical protein [Crocinitomicaceae bacterium]